MCFGSPERLLQPQRLLQRAERYGGRADSGREGGPPHALMQAVAAKRALLVRQLAILQLSCARNAQFTEEGRP